MTMRTSTARAVAMAAAAAPAKRPTSPPTHAPMEKRRRFVPTPLDSAVKGGEDVKAISNQPRYALRRRGSDTSMATTSSVKVEDSGVDGDGAAKSVARSPTKKDPFAVSPRKKGVKPIKLELDQSEARAAPKRWKEQYMVLSKQRQRIVAPVDTMGCQENGKEEKREDRDRVEESEEERGKRERFTLLVSLMLSSQTKDPVTAEAVHNLQRNLTGGLCLSSILEASQDDISTNICKVGFWRRKTGYVQSAAKIIRDDFGGDVPNTIDDLCSLPGVGPKMGFLALQGAWGLNVGIGVDVHVHRVANRLKWVNSTDPEGTRLQLQSWLPKEMHPTINKTLVGFGQVICQPVGPRCDLCALGSARLCPSYRKVDPKSIASRVKIELLPQGDEEKDESAVKVEGPDGQGSLLVPGEEDDKASLGVTVKAEAGDDRLAW